MSKDWELYAHHILDCIDKLDMIQKRGDIATDSVLYDAALRNLQTLSEAKRHLPDLQKSLHNHIPWKDISGFRNILVHDYLGEIDPVTVDKVITEHLKPLKIAISSMLNQKN